MKKKFLSTHTFLSCWKQTYFIHIDIRSYCLLILQLYNYACSCQWTFRLFSDTHFYTHCCSEHYNTCFLVHMGRNYSIYLGVIFLGHRICTFLTLQNSAKSFSKLFILFPVQNTSSYCFISFTTFIIVWLFSWKWYLIESLSCTSSVSYKVEFFSYVSEFPFLWNDYSGSFFSPIFLLSCISFSHWFWGVFGYVTHFD